MQIWAESGKSALPICNYSQILYRFLAFTQNLKRSPANQCNLEIAQNILGNSARFLCLPLFQYLPKLQRMWHIQRGLIQNIFLDKDFRRSTICQKFSVGQYDHP